MINSCNPIPFDNFVLHGFLRFQCGERNNIIIVCCADFFNVTIDAAEILYWVSIPNRLIHIID